MAVYKCAICGIVFDEEKESLRLAEAGVCPVCRMPKSHFVDRDDNHGLKKDSTPRGMLDDDLFFKLYD